MTREEKIRKFLELIRAYDFHIGDGVDDCAGSDKEAEMIAAILLYDEFVKLLKK